MKVKSGRIDHLGIVAGVIKDLKIVELIDERISQDVREEISTGEAIVGMIINGLGFSDRPMSLTPQFFQNKAMEQLFREGVTADHFNRHKLGRALDNCYFYGTDRLFAEISLAVCRQEKIDCRFNSEDTTTFSVTGEYDRDSDENAISITHGYSKDHRPDLKQAVLEMMVTQDGGIPIISKSWSGNASDSKIFRERSMALLEAFKKSDSPRFLIADSKLYAQETIQGPLRDIPFITRVPSVVKQEQLRIAEALKTPSDQWTQLDDRNRCYTIELEHYGQKQRWIIIGSDDMRNRSRKSVEKALMREHETLKKEVNKITKVDFACEIDAKNAFNRVNKRLKYHCVRAEKILEKKEFSSKGRPGPNTPHTMTYRVYGRIERDEEAIEKRVQQKSCYVLATTIPVGELSSEEVVAAYKGQNSSVERGFRFLKDPVFFTSSLFVKKPERIEGLLMMMTLALLVFSVAQRRLRAHLQAENETLPNQIKKETNKPTLRWIFQLMEGIEHVQVAIDGVLRHTIAGLTALRLRILACFSPSVRKIYGLEI